MPKYHLQQRTAATTLTVGEPAYKDTFEGVAHSGMRVGLATLTGMVTGALVTSAQLALPSMAGWPGAAGGLLLGFGAGYMLPAESTSERITNGLKATAAGLVPTAAGLAGLKPVNQVLTSVGAYGGAFWAATAMEDHNERVFSSPR